MSNSQGSPLNRDNILNMVRQVDQQNGYNRTMAPKGGAEGGATLPSVKVFDDTWNQKNTFLFSLV